MLRRFTTSRISTHLSQTQPIYKRLGWQSLSSATNNNNPQQPKNHALIIGGGKSGRVVIDSICTSYSEDIEFINAKQIYSTLTSRNIVNPGNIRVLFGNGDKHSKTIVYRSLFLRLIYNIDLMLAKMGYEDGIKEVFYKEDKTGDLPVTGVASMKNVSEALADFSKKVQPHDRLFIFLEGHGQKGLGVILWNKYFNREFLTPKQLEQWLNQFHPDVRVFLYVKSCYSGNFLTLNRRNFYTYVSSVFMKVSYREIEKVSGMLLTFLNGFAGGQFFLKLHALGASKDSNYFPSDSLSAYLTKELMSCTPYRKVYGLLVLYQKAMINFYSQARRGIVIQFTSGFVLALGVGYLLPADHILNKMIMAKVALTGAKAVVPIILKVGYVLLLQKYFIHLENKFKSTRFYKHYPIILDEIYIKDLIQQLSIHKPILHPEVVKLTNEKRDELILILAMLFDLRIKELNEPVISPYTLLFRQAVLFLQYASRNNNMAAIKRFIDISHQMLDPLEQGLAKNSVSERAKQFTTRYLVKKSIFSKGNEPLALENRGDSAPSFGVKP